MTTLFVNACAHDESRTLSLCRAYLEGNPAVEEVRLFERNLAPFDWKMVEQRVALIEKADWGDSMFDLAKQFAAADEIVIGTPYWDLSFPAVLKIYIEHVTVNVPLHRRGKARRTLQSEAPCVYHHVRWSLLVRELRVRILSGHRAHVRHP